MDKNIEFLQGLDAEIVKVELICFLENDEIEPEIAEQFIDFIKEDLSRADE